MCHCACGCERRVYAHSCLCADLCQIDSLSVCVCVCVGIFNRDIFIGSMQRKKLIYQLCVGPNLQSYSSIVCQDSERDVNTMDVSISNNCDLEESVKAQWSLSTQSADCRPLTYSQADAVHILASRVCVCVCVCVRVCAYVRVCVRCMGGI